MLQDNNPELAELVERDAVKSLVRVLAMLAIGASAFSSAVSLNSMYFTVADQSTPLVICPKNYSLDAPVLMKTIDEASVTHQDRYVRGFVRRFVVSLFPRTEADTEPFLRYVINHSEGAVREKYQAFMSNLKDYNELINSGFYNQFYPKSSSEVRIRQADSGDEWIVEIDGFMIANRGYSDKRSEPTLTLRVKTGERTITNAEGLYVVSTNLSAIADYVSGRKEETK